MPKIGIFWVFNKKVLGKTRTLAEGCKSGEGLLDSPDGHCDVWDESIQRMDPGLRHLDYTEVPRGRVIFSTKDRQAIIYLDETLTAPAIRKRIGAFFDLQNTDVTWKQGRHYTTNAQKIDALFEAEFPRG